MAEQKKKKSGELRVGIILLLLSCVLFLIAPDKVTASLRTNFALALKILALSVVAVIISVAVNFLVPPDFAEKHLAGGKAKHLVYATILGILTPGPVYAIYPIVFALKKKGVENSILVSYITGQTIMGPARVPLEIGVMGLRFFLYRLLLSLLMGPLAGLLYMIMSRKFPDPEDLGEKTIVREISL